MRSGSRNTPGLEFSRENSGLLAEARTTESSIPRSVISRRRISRGETVTRLSFFTGKLSRRLLENRAPASFDYTRRDNLEVQRGGARGRYMLISSTIRSRRRFLTTTAQDEIPWNCRDGDGLDAGRVSYARFDSEFPWSLDLKNVLHYPDIVSSVALTRVDTITRSSRYRVT